VPALLATRSATEVLRPGAEVTVDATAGVVYEGRVDGLLAGSGARPAPAGAGPGRDLLAAVAGDIVPLTLPDRLASGFSPGRCRTLHDIIRFCHQGAVEAMFAAGDRASRGGAHLRRLKSPVPVFCHLLDLGGGLVEGAPPDEVTIDDVACPALRAFWRGMTDGRVDWRAERPVTAGGFMSSVANFGYDEDDRVRALGDPSYVFLTRDYFSLNARVGYHFSTVDARMGEPADSNYLSFRFVGGSTGVDQRSRRARLMEHVLGAKGFETDRRADLVNARVRHLPAAVMEEKIEFLGLLLAGVNHLDMAMASDAVARTYEEAFLAGNFGFRGGARA
jgi:pyruvate,water dikinase